MSSARAIIAIAVVWQAAAWALAQSPAQPADSPAGLPAFHRLFLPEREIEERAWKHRYLPVEADEFERDLKIVADYRRGAPSAETPRLEKAIFVAQLIGEDVLVGTAQLVLAGEVEQPKLLSLGGCSFAVESAHWPELDRPATIALDSAGDLKLLVAEKRLDLRWSQRGQRTASGAVQFELNLPRSLVGELELTVPAGAEIVAEGGIVAPPVEPPGETSASSSRWHIELGGSAALRLRVIPRESAGQRRPLTLLRQSTTYEFSTRGINVAAQLRLDVHGEPLERLKIDLDRPLHLISAKAGDVPIPWSSATDVETGETHVILEFQEPLSGTGKVIQLTSVTPLVTGETIPLPRVQPRQIAWQEGSANLLIPAILVLERLKTTGCRQSRVTTLPAPLTGESIEIQFYQPDGLIETRVAEPKQKLSLRSGHLIEVGPDTLVTSSQFEVGGSRPATELDLPLRAGWIVDSVKNAGSDDPLTWDVEEGEANSVLHVRSSAIQRILVRAHTALDTNRPLRAAAARAFDLTSFAAPAELVSVRGSDGFEVRWQDESWQGRETAALSADELQLFAEPPTQTVVLADDRSDDAQFSIERERPEFTADLHVDVVVQGQALTETFTILCTPAASRIDRLLVHLSQKREENVKWSLAGGNNSGEFSARRLSDGEQAKLGIPQGEVWELILKLERQGTFEVRGQRKAGFTAETPVALASLQGAANQRGTLAIRALGETGLAIRNRNLKSVPAETLGDENYQTARAAFHYPPSAVDFAAQSAVTLVPSKPLQASTGAWIWDLALITRFDSKGQLTHRGVAEIQTAGRRSVKIELPAQSALLGVWIDGRQVARLEFGRRESPFTVDLPSGSSRSRLVVEYSTPAALPTLIGKFSPPFPTLDVPVVRREWQLWLPPGYVVGDASGWMSPTQSVPLSWSERLFGLLGRGGGRNLFNPLIASDWRDGVGGRTAADQASDRATQFLATVGNLLAQSRGAEDLTWGQMLSTAAELENAAGATLLVDRDALADAGIGPTQRLPVADASGDVSAVQLGRIWLKSSGLFLVTTADRVLLTTAATAAGFDSLVLAQIGGEPVASARGALDLLLRSAPGDESAFCPVASWQGEAEPVALQADEPSLGLTAPAGWRRYDIPCSVAAENHVRVVHSSRMQSLAWAILLGAVGLCLWRPILRGGSLILALGSLAAVALLVPVSFTPLASAALLGVVIGALARLTAIARPADSTVSAMPLRPSPSKLAKPVAGGLLFAAIVNGAAALDAAETNSPPSQSAEEPLYTVLFPTDENRQPSGSKVFVPEPFYETLLRESAAASGRPQGWLVTRADYEGVVSRDAVAGTSLPALKVRFELNVFQSNVPIRLPFSHDVWRQAAGSARLDGKPLAAEARQDFGLLLEPLPLGRHLLEIELRPAAISDARQASIDFEIPRVAQATLRLSGTADLENIRVSSARGRVTLDAQRDSLVAQLGAADRMTIRWPTVQVNAAAAANLEVEELLWVRVRPGTTVLDARLKFQVSSGELRTVRLATDPRLRLLSSPANGALVAAVRTFPGSPQVIEFDLAQPVRDSVTLDVSFLVADASGLGNLRLPQLDSLDARPVRRWLGVSVDPALQYRIQAGEDSPGVEIARFLEAWGIGDAKPLAGFAISRGEPIWFLATQPAEPKVTVQQKTELSIGRRSAQVRFEASLDISSGVLAQLAIAGPPNFKPERVSVLDQDVERVARWSASDEGELNVFLTAPISGRQQLILTGRWALPDAAAFTAPRWELRAATTSRAQWQFYRQSEILLTVNAPPEARPLDAAPDANRIQPGALAAAFQADRADLAIGLQVDANDPHVKMATVTSVRREGDRYLAQVDCKVDVTDGLLDVLRFEVPPQFVEPFRAEPAATVAVSTATATQRRILTITPAAPWSGKQALRIQGRITPSPGDGLKVPDIQPLAVDEIDRFVLLPNRFDSQPVSWDISRLSAAKLPAELVPRGWKPDAAVSYQARDGGFQAVMKSADREDAATAIQLADIHLAWLPGGVCRAVAQYDLIPGGASDCELQMPSGTKLIHATVEHLPASLVEQGEGKYRLSLGPQNLPQRIELLYEAAHPESFRRPELVAPRLAGTTPLQTLWTLYHAPRERVVPLEQRFTVSASDQCLVRLTNSARLVDLPADVLSEHLPEEISRWYASWRKRYRNDRLLLRQSLIAADRDPSNSEEAGEARSLDQKMAALDDRLGGNSLAGRAAFTPDLVQSFADSAAAGLVPQFFSLKAADGPLKVRYARGADDAPWRWLSASAVLLLGCVAGWQLRGRELPQFPLLAIALAVATFWWLFLGASMWGLLAVALIVLALAWKHSRPASQQ